MNLYEQSSDCSLVYPYTGASQSSLIISSLPLILNSLLGSPSPCLLPLPPQHLLAAPLDQSPSTLRHHQVSLPISSEFPTLEQSLIEADCCQKCPLPLPLLSPGLPLTMYTSTTSKLLAKPSKTSFGRPPKLGPTTTRRPPSQVLPHPLGITTLPSLLPSPPLSPPSSFPLSSSIRGTLTLFCPASCWSTH